MMTTDIQRSRSRRRWLLGATLLLVGGSLLALMLTSFTDNLVYFRTPSEVAAQSTTLEGRRIRLGGMVKDGSIQKQDGTLKIRFVVTDGTHELPVRHEGLLPALFREGQGVVAEGIWRPGQDFTADTIMAKHSEDYVPIDMSAQGVDKARESILRTLQ
jgi:cytochrome c-type biogenesis protein CcmE